uniref:Uncharacterized protein n=1 Tax=Arundo donax TaxID=35708 RepID=A0A0A9HLB1_ARUDO
MSWTGKLYGKAFEGFGEFHLRENDSATRKAPQGFAGWVLGLGRVLGPNTAPINMRIQCKRFFLIIPTCHRPLLLLPNAVGNKMMDLVTFMVDMA